MKRQRWAGQVAIAAMMALGVTESTPGCGNSPSSGPPSSESDAGPLDGTTSSGGASSSGSSSGAGGSSSGLSSGSGGSSSGSSSSGSGSSGGSSSGASGSSGGTVGDASDAQVACEAGALRCVNDSDSSSVDCLETCQADGTWSGQVQCPCTACAPGATLCRRDFYTTVCVDTTTDLDNCGTCGHACPSGATCTAGTCACPPGQTTCEPSRPDGGTSRGVCSDTTTDLNNCGTCGHTCASGATCTAGMCACPSSQPTVCSGTCVDMTTDVHNCGSCGNACAAGASCTGGACLCPSDHPTVCSGTCLATPSDRHNCGSCGTVCPGGQECISGACQSVAGSLYAPCSPATTDLSTAPVPGSGGCQSPLSCVQVPLLDGGTGTCDGGACSGVCTVLCRSLTCRSGLGSCRPPASSACSSVGGTCLVRSVQASCSLAGVGTSTYCISDCEP